ncbi:uncharacterized protein VTP21DRAFT_10282 [Calcarisporiella thermophila]|uniref:uncharacterized protein n=1 Tax=Calcarisporiella thermophila TaxID=911321 RepID=UPI0037432CB0
MEQPEPDSRNGKYCDWLEAWVRAGSPNDDGWQNKSTTYGSTRLTYLACVSSDSNLPPLLSGEGCNDHGLWIRGCAHAAPPSIPHGRYPQPKQGACGCNARFHSTFLQGGPGPHNALASKFANPPDFKLQRTQTQSLMGRRGEAVQGPQTEQGWQPSFSRPQSPAKLPADSRQEHSAGQPVAAAVRPSSLVAIPRPLSIKPFSPNPVAAPP